MRFDGVRFAVVDSRGGPLALLADREDGLWYAPFNRGVTWLAAGRATTWTTREGLPADQVSQMLQDRDGVLWIGTPRGLARLRNGRS